MHIVPTMEEAKKLENELGIECNYDFSIMIKTPKNDIELKRDELKQRAWELRKQGKSLRAIGNELDRSHSIISNWINEIKKQAIQQEGIEIAA